jgi:SGNH domain (fused to AT3 domains)
MIALTFFLASMTYVFVEKPLRHTQLKPMAAIIYISMASLAAFSFFLYANNGLHSRLVAAKENPQFTSLNSEFHTQKTQILGCYKAFNRINPPFECMPNAKENPVVLIGDSTANALYSPLLESLPSLQLFWQASCFPFKVQDTKGVLRPEYANCAEFNVAMRKYLAKNEHPLIIHTRVPFKYKQEVLNEEEKQQAKQKGLHVADKFDLAFYASLQEFLLDLKGQNVIFVLSPPIFEKQAKLCLMRPLQRTKPQSCTLSFEEHEQNYATYRANLEHLIKALPYIKFLRVEHFFCDENKCPIAREGKLLYADEVHLTPSGLQPLVKAIKQAINDTSKTQRY